MDERSFVDYNALVKPITWYQEDSLGLATLVEASGIIEIPVFHQVWRNSTNIKYYLSATSRIRVQFKDGIRISYGLMAWYRNRDTRLMTFTQCIFYILVHVDVVC